MELLFWHVAIIGILCLVWRFCVFFDWLIERQSIHFHQVFPDRWWAYTWMYYYEVPRMSYEELDALRHYIWDYKEELKELYRDVHGKFCNYPGYSERMLKLKWRVDEYYQEARKVHEGKLNKEQKAEKVKRDWQGKRAELYGNFKGAIDERKGTAFIALKQAMETD